MSHSPEITGYAPQQANAGDRRHLRAVRVGLGLLSFAALIALAFLRPHVSSRPAIETISRVACTLTWWSGAYFITTALLSLKRSAATRRAVRLFPHAVVFISALVCLARAYRSVALLAGLDQLLSMLVALSVTALALASLETNGSEVSQSGTARANIFIQALQALAAIGIAMTLAYVEFSPS